jgi:type IV pilus assembly protein PilY1
MGSGYRSRPLNIVVKERYYVLFDKDATRSDIATAELSTLQPVIATPDLAELDMTSASVKTNGVDVTNKKGWYINFPESGEKSLATGLIFNSKLVFTAYSPSLSGATNCSPVTGKTNQYVFCMPYGKLCSTTSDYVKKSVMLGLGGAPQLMVIPDPNNPGKFKVTLLVGTSLDPNTFSDAGSGYPVLVPTKKWREKTANE